MDKENENTIYEYCSELNQYYKVENCMRIPVTKKEIKTIEKTQGTEGTDFFKKIKIDELDSNPHFLNTNNCIIDMAQKAIITNSDVRFIAKSPLDFNAEYKEKSEFIKFLNTIFDNNTDVINYFQRVLGYCISGYSNEQCAFFLVGTGANGKTTLLELIRSIFGSYATTVNHNIVLKDNRQANNELINLVGKRLGIINEFPSNNKLNTYRYNQIVGNDSIGMDYAHNRIEFHNKAKLFFVCNTFPIIEDFTHGFWRKCHIIPFTKTISQEDRNLDIYDILIKERQGILNWILEGYIIWKKEQLNLPKCLKEVIDCYKSEYDSVGEFIDRRCNIGENKLIFSSEFNNAYKIFCQDNCYQLYPPNKVGMILKQKGFTAIKKHKQRGYLGLELLNGGSK